MSDRPGTQGPHTSAADAHAQAKTDAQARPDDHRWHTLITAARDRDPAALEHLVQTMSPELHAYVRLNVGPRLRELESCSDVVQSVCREVVQDIRDFRGHARPQFRQWLFSVALRKIRSKARYHNAARRDADRRSDIQDDVDSDPFLHNVYRSICTPSRHAGVREEIAQMEAAFTKLPDDYREVINLCCIVGLPYPDAAARMGRSEVALRKLLSRARAKLSLLIAMQASRPHRHDPVADDPDQPPKAP